METCMAAERRSGPPAAASARATATRLAAHLQSVWEICTERILQTK